MAFAPFGIFVLWHVLTTGSEWLPIDPVLGVAIFLAVLAGGFLIAWRAAK